MKMKIRKILAYTLSVLMALTLVPFVARAGEDVLEENGEKTVIVGEEGEGENGAGTETQVTEVTPTTEEGEQTPEEVVDPTPKEEVVEDTTEETEEVSQDTAEEPVVEVADVPVQKPAAKLKGASGLKGAPALGTFTINASVYRGETLIKDEQAQFQMEYDPNLFTLEVDNSNASGTEIDDGKSYYVYYVGCNEYPVITAKYDGGDLPSEYELKVTYSKWSGTDNWSGHTDPPTGKGGYNVSGTIVNKSTGEELSGKSIGCGFMLNDRVSYVLEFHKNMPNDTTEPIYRSTPARSVYDIASNPVTFTDVPSSHTFDGWYTDASCSAGNKFDFSKMITKDMLDATNTLHLYAKWNHATNNFVTHEAKEPTCTVDGNIEYYECPVCNKKYSDAAGTTEVASVVRPAGHNLTPVSTKAATCTESGVAKEYGYCSKCGKAFKYVYPDGLEEISEQTLNSEYIIAPLGHDYLVPSYVWSDDNSMVTAERKCGRAGCTYAITEEVESTVDTTAATCTKAGQIKYTATFTKSDFTTQTKTETLDALNHDWSDITYSWSEDHSTVTASRTCKRDNCGEVESETVDAKEIVTKAPTCTEDGAATYTASFTNPVFTDQTENVTLPAIGHDWDKPVYEWADDKSTVTASRKCKNDPTHIETETVNTKYDVTKPQTETEAGSGVYTADFTNPAFESQYAYVVNGEDKIVYLNVTEGGLSYTKGSGEPLVSRFERSIDNPSTINHFQGINVDGKDVPTQNYDAKSGSVIISLKPSYLDTLAPGEHTLKVLFDDGVTTTKFNIVAENVETVVVKKETNKEVVEKEAKKAKTAKTGDATPMMICIIVMIISAAAAVMILIKKNKLVFRK